MTTPPDAPVATDAPPEPAAAPAGPFRRRTLWILGAVVVVSLAAMVALSLLVDDLEGPPAAGTDAYSRSAIGHHGLVRLLENVKVPVVISQANSSERAKEGLLVLAEPRAGDPDSDRRLTEVIQTSPRVLIVLPKWWGLTSPTDPGWLGAVDLVTEDEVTDVLAALGIERGRFARSPDALVTGGVTIAHAPQSITIDDSWDDALVADGTRGFVLRVPHGTTTLTIITDPDLLNNHGLDEGGNAAFVVSLIEELRHGGPVVFDEVSHGYVREPGIWRLLFRYPLVLATIQALLCAVFLGLATRGRFGPPADVPPPLGAGKEFLIRHTATLLRHGGHDAAMLRRYLVSTVQQVKAALHAPRDMTAAHAVAWLERIGHARKVSVSLSELEREVAAVESDRTQVRRAAAIATRIHRWRQEMTLGSGNHP